MARRITFLIAFLLVSGSSEVASALDFHWDGPSEVAITAASYDAAGSVTLSLGFEPASGTDLTLINNTGLDVIQGTFSNLAQGEVVSLTFSGKTFEFAVNYFGGTGNDLVLVWKHQRLFTVTNVAFDVPNYALAPFGPPSSLIRAQPKPVKGLPVGTTLFNAAAGANHQLVVTSTGTVMACGQNNAGQLGDNSTIDRASLVPVDTTAGASALAGKTVIALAAGFNHSVALCSDGTVATWGSNDEGQLGNDSAVSSPVPVAVSTSPGVSALAGKRVIAIAAGFNHSMALCSDGTVVTWGSNSEGQLGNGTTTGSLVPVAVSTEAGVSALAGRTVTSIAAGGSHNLALCSNGALVAWGDSKDGQLGAGPSFDPSLVPVLVSRDFGVSALADKTVTTIAAGRWVSWALCDDGTISHWGYAVNNGSVPQLLATETFTLPESQLYGKTVASLAIGSASAFALCTDGAAASWSSFSDFGGLSPLPHVVNLEPLNQGERISCFIGGPTGDTALAIAARPAPPPGPLPTMAVTVGSLSVEDGVPSASIGTMAIQDQPATLTVEISNQGTAPLTGITPSVTGLRAVDCAINTDAMATTLAPGASTAFNVIFTPTASVSNITAFTVHITSSDPFASPFDIPVKAWVYNTRWADDDIVANEGSTVLVRLNRSNFAGAGSVRVMTTSNSSGVPDADSSIPTADSGDFVSINNHVVNFAAGQSTAIIAVTILSDAVDEPNEQLYLQVLSGPGDAQVGPITKKRILILGLADEKKPVIQVVHPKSNATVTNDGSQGYEGITARFLATDNQSLGKVWVSLNGGPLIAVEAGTLSNGSNYSAVLDAVPGRNTLTVQAVDSVGNTSAPITRTFTYVRLSPLTVGVTGQGRVTAPYPGVKGVPEGARVALVATPLPGQVFSGWSDALGHTLLSAAQLERPAITFTHARGIALTANFVLNPFTPEVVGRYDGLVTAQTGPPTSHATIGLITSTVTRAGVLTGTLKMGGYTWPLNAALTSHGDARFGTARTPVALLPRAGLAPLELALNLELGDATSHPLTGTITERLRGSVTSVRVFNALRTPYGALNKAPSHLAGTTAAGQRYSLILQHQSQPQGGLDANDFPLGDGYATGTLLPTGAITFTGKLADHTPFTLSTVLAYNHTWPCFLPLYSGAGGFQSQVTVDDTQWPDRDMTGANTVWFRPWQNVQWYPWGWSSGIAVDLMAAKYVSTPASAWTGLPPTDAIALTATFRDGGLPATQSRPLSLSASNAATKPVPDASWTFTLAPKTGLFTGSFPHPGSSAKPPFQGVLYQKGPLQGGRGYFMTPSPRIKDGTGLSGGVRLTAP